MEAWRAQVQQAWEVEVAKVEEVAELPVVVAVAELLEVALQVHEVRPQPPH